MQVTELLQKEPKYQNTKYWLSKPLTPPKKQPQKTTIYYTVENSLY